MTTLYASITMVSVFMRYNISVSRHLQIWNKFQKQWNNLLNTSETSAK